MFTHPYGKSSGFNEAPALRGGNRRLAREGQKLKAASMRPPHCAGEINTACFRMATFMLASMRPPHCAGEIELIDSCRLDIGKLQ